MPSPVTLFRNAAKSAALSAIIALTLASGSVLADELALQDNAPERYVVVKGDTLWAISGKFLKDPWKWPRIWNMNKEEIKNPHWIFPGDVIVLDRTGGEPHLRLLGNADNDALRSKLIKAGPHVRVSSIEERAAPAIPRKYIEPLLSHPLVVEKDSFDHAPRIALSPDEHLIFGPGDTFYAVGIQGGAGDNWQVYEDPKEILDPETKELLGYEVTYCGDAVATAVGKVTTMHATTGVRELRVGDRLIEKEREEVVNYVPHVPLLPVSGKILETYGGFGEASIYTTVLINKGTRDGLAPGHVFFSYSAPRPVQKEDGTPDKDAMTPAEQSGTIYIYRVFDKLAYGLVVNSTKAIRAMDVVTTP